MRMIVVSSISISISSLVTTIILHSNDGKYRILAKIKKGRKLFVGNGSFDLLKYQILFMIPYPKVCCIGKFGHDSASRPASCVQVKYFSNYITNHWAWLIFFCSQKISFNFSSLSILLLNLKNWTTWLHDTGLATLSYLQSQNLIFCHFVFTIAIWDIRLSWLVQLYTYSLELPCIGTRRHSVP